MTSKWQQFYADPFSFFDNLNLRLGFLDFNLYRNFAKLRKTIFIFALVSIVGWVVMGFDSTPLQIFNPLVEIVRLFRESMVFTSFGNATTTITGRKCIGVRL